MKLITITLLLLSSVTFANVKVTVTKDGKIKNQGTFETQELAEAWVADNEKTLKGKQYRNSFGLVDRWLKEDLGNYSEVRVVEIPASKGREAYSYNEYKYLQDYVVKYEDVSKQVAAEKAKKLKDSQDMLTILSKIKDGTAKLEDVINYIKIKEGI